ncbi:MAG: arsenite methyltransferase [Elusimicrobiota bacterium]
MNNKEIKKVVREGYAKVAKQDSSCCTSKCSCCGDTVNTESISKRIGYTEEELTSVPEGANLGLGCGNPVAIASLKEGETVLDLGSGPGFDCFLAAKKVGKNGRVIGIDMTPEMIKKAKENAKKGNYQNVEFKLGEIENLPVGDNSVDIIISNCVINLSPDKDKVFKEAFRVLKPGGRIMISDIVLLKALPDAVKESVEANIGCLAGAMMKPDYIKTIEAVGFKEVKIIDETFFPVEFMTNDPAVQTIIKNLNISIEEIKALANSAVSIKVYGIKPNN